MMDNTVVRKQAQTMAVIVHWGDHALTTATVSSLREEAHLFPEQVLVIENGVPCDLPRSMAHVLTLRENLGYAAALNVGFTEALRKGAHYVLALNNDLRYRQGTLEAMLSVLNQSRNRVGCVGVRLDEGDIRPVYGGGRVSWALGRTVPAHSPQSAQRLQYISGACFLVAKACLEDVGGLPEHYFLYWEDVAYGFLIRARGWGLAYAATSLPLLHPRSQGMRDPAVKTYYLVRNGALFIRRFAPPWARRWLLSLEPARLQWAAARNRWEIVHGLQDARRNVTGVLSGRVDLHAPPL